MQNHIVSVTQQVKHLGKRLTVQRRAVLLHMLTIQQHPTAKDVYHALKTEMPNITLSTVYTSLRFFVKMGILKEHVHHDLPNQFECTITIDDIHLPEVI